MLIRLTLKEIKYQLKSITFFLFFAILILFYSTQFLPEVSGFQKPTPGENHYGTAPITNQTDEIKVVYDSIKNELDVGCFLKYGSIINRTTALSDDEKTAMSDALKAISPKGEENGKLDIAVTYDQYLTIVRNLDKKLGGSTCYGDKKRYVILNRPITYEEALERYNNIINVDKFSNAAARLFADYMGITAGFFPIFLSAFILTKDKRTKSHEVIYSRSISSINYVLAKYLAICLCISICYLLLASYSTFITLRISEHYNYQIDYIAFFKYTLIWIIPTIMFTTAAGMFISIVFGNGIAAFPFQFIFWMSSMLPLKGDYGLLKTIIRFNTLGDYPSYVKWANAIFINRIFYTSLSLILISITILVCSKKRGECDGSLRRFFSLHKIQS